MARVLSIDEVVKKIKDKETELNVLCKRAVIACCDTTFLFLFFFFLGILIKEREIRLIKDAMKESKSLKSLHFGCTLYRFLLLLCIRFFLMYIQLHWAR